MRILLTGASGFIGRQTLTALVGQGHHVIAVGRVKPIADLQAEWRDVNLLKPGTPGQLVRDVKPDSILHLAWTGEPGVFWNDPANLDWIAASMELARAGAECGVRRMCTAGTCFEYQWPSGGDCDEALTPLRGHTLYGISKDACRRVLKAYSDVCGMSFGWARLFYLYGPDEHPDRLVASIARALVSNKEARASRGLAVRDYMDSRDAGRALATFLTSSVEGEVNVASGERHSIAQIATTLGRLAQRPDLVKLGALPDRPDEPMRITARVDRLHREVGFAPQYDLETGLGDALGFWRDKGGL